MTDTFQFKDPTANPAEANAEIAKILADGEAKAPTIAPQPSGFVRLPGGLVPAPGEPVTYEAEVKELTGEDEEYIDRVRSGNPERFFEAILERGIKSLGGQKPTRALIGELLMGDADFLFLAVRRATYGDMIEYTDFRCPECGDLMDVEIDLDDVPVTRLENNERVFPVDLRKGRVAHVRIPKFADFVGLSETKIDAERKTLLLARLVNYLEVPGGDPIPVAGDPAVARSIGLVDRTTILEAVTKKKIGPNYNEVRLTHDSCGKEVFFPVDMGDLFPGL